VTLVVTDDQGAPSTAAATLNVKPLPADAYGMAVVGDNPTFYWRLNEANGSTAADESVNGVNGVYSGGITYQTPSTVTGPTGTGITTNGSDSQVTSGQTFTNPTVYSEELWFNTTTTTGGKLIGFGDQPTGFSGNYDRHVWMLNSGQLEFGVWTGNPNTITSPNSYNDGKWHQVVATEGPSGMVLYVDGQPVGTNGNNQAQSYTGYWRVGGDVTWGGSDSQYFAGAIDEVAVYPTALSAGQVAAHYNAAPVTAPANQSPTAVFSQTCTNLACAFDGSTSHDSDGTIASYLWDFSDGATSTLAKPNHTFAAAGDYQVSLTVTDNGGATSTVINTVTVTVPANQSPTAVFSQTCTNLACVFDGSTSTDPDGTIAGYAWDFGDTTTSGVAKPNHTFAAAGDYQVRLTVTDNDGATKTLIKTVTVTAPVNKAPVAAFTPTCTNLVCSVDGSASADPDGTIAGYAWTFGDGGAATGVTASRPYTAAGDYTITLTVTDNGGATNAITHTVSPRPPANPSSTPYGTDIFNRTVASGWGSADTGGAWAGSTTSLSVAAGAGSVKMAAAGSGPTVYLSSVSTADTNTAVTLTTDKAATGGGIFMATVGRRVSASIDYRARVRLLNNNTVGVALLSENAGTETLLKGEQSLGGVTYTPGMQLKVRLQVTGTSPTTLRVKVWPATATEPTAWLLSTTDSAPALQVAGTVGLAAYLSGTATNAPVIMKASAFSTGPTVAPPTAAFTWNCTGQTCSVDGSTSTDPSGTISSYQWSWGDGVVTAGVTSSHTFADPGTFRITLTVTDPSGWTSVTTRTVTVPA
jgi:PKD repeat protein